MKIQLQVTDQKTGEDIIITVGMHDAQKLYKALRELVGDAQYQSQPNSLITIPDVRLKV
jgi:hypothetical protein